MTKGKVRGSLIDEIREIRDKVDGLTRTYCKDILLAVLADGEKRTIAEIHTRLRRAGLPHLRTKELRQGLKALVEEKRLVSEPTDQQGLPEAFGLKMRDS